MILHGHYFAGQSNCQGNGVRLQLKPQNGDIPTWAQTTANGWTGAPHVSSDSPYRLYNYPSITNFPCLSNENNSATDALLYDSWGRFEGERQTSPGAYSIVGGYGSELSLLRNYQDHFPTAKIAYIKHCLGGSSLENDWMPGLASTKRLWPLFVRSVVEAEARAAANGDTIEWKCFWWIHGESGAHTANTTSTVYRDKARIFFAAVREVMHTPNLLIGIRRISDLWLADKAIRSSYGVAVTPTQAQLDAYRAGAVWRRSIQDELAHDLNCFGWNSDGEEERLGPPWTNDALGYHHSGPGHLADGERAFSAYLAKIGEAPPPPPPPPVPLVVNFNGVPKPWSVKLNGAPIGGDGDVIDVEGVE